jgi:hypothetical protein
MTEQLQLLGGLEIGVQSAPKSKPNPDLDNDGEREQVWDVMKDGDWYTFAQVQRLVKIRFDRFYSEASISARIRDFRKGAYGGYKVERALASPEFAPRFYKYRIVRPQ